MKPERGQYRSITLALLDGPDFQALPPEARSVFLMLKIGLGPCGIQVEYPDALVAQLVARTGYPVEVVAAMLDELQASGWVMAERNVVWIVKQLEFEPAMTFRNEKHCTAVLAHVKGLPRLAIVGEFIRQYRAYLTDADELAKVYPKATDSLCVAYGKGTDTLPNHRDRDGVPKPKNETEEVPTATQSASRAGDAVEVPDGEPAPTEGQVLATVRRVLWAPDGVPPPDDGAGKAWTDGREIGVIRGLVGQGETTDDLIRAVHGLRLLQLQGEVDWLPAGVKVTLRAVYNSKNGSRDMLTQALDAYARGSPEAHAPRKSGQRRADIVRADFILAAERAKRGIA